MFQFKFLNELNECLKTINDGGIILHPTDTVYGLGGNANDNNVTRKINQIKKRELDQPLIHLMSDIEMVSCYVENISETAIEFLSDSNPTTVIFSNTNGKNTNLKSIAVRIPSDNFCLSLIKELKYPLSSSSANLHGFEVPNSLERVDKLIKDNVDYIVRTSKIFNKIPSRIIKMNGDNKFKVIR
tara:strand:+ start:1157 stop:1711 length:555 start_codon:yes stop_codon:yes gene_type:complete